MIIEYIIDVKSEYHIGTGLERPGVADRTLVCRSDESLVIPSAHFRGLVRDACTQIIYWQGKKSECCEASLTKAPLQNPKSNQNDDKIKIPQTCGLTIREGGEPCVLCRLFGTTFTPGRYEFSDNVILCEKIEKDKRISTHNRVEPAIGRTPEETFFSFEIGKESKFKGTIKRNSPQKCHEMLMEEIGLLLAGLRLIERVGSRSRRGWGQCRVCIDKISTDCNETLHKDIINIDDISTKVDKILGHYLKVDQAEQVLR